MERNKNTLEEIKETTEDTFREMERIMYRPREALKRFSTLFLLLVTAGAVLVFFGFERVFDKITLLHDNPVLMIIAGLVILVFTGQLYKRLS